MKKNPVIFVMARMTSSRLPGKVLMEVRGRPLLDYQLERLKRVELANDIVVTTTTNATDDAVVRVAEDHGVGVFRGSELDTVNRLLEASRTRGADPVVRVTGDCPLIDPATVDAVIDEITTHDCDYVVTDDIPPRHPNGMGCEAFSADALARLHAVTRSAVPDREWEKIRSPDLGLTIRTLAGPEPSLGHHRWTVDTPADFELVSKILDALYPENPDFGLTDIVALIDANPHWALINSYVRQKTGPHAAGPLNSPA